MKRKVWGWLAVITVVSSCVWVLFFPRENERVVVVYERNEASTEHVVKKTVLSHQKETLKVKFALRTAVKLPAVQHMIPPTYLLQIGDETYQLWLTRNADKVYGTIINETNKNDAYKLTTFSSSQLYNMIHTEKND